MELQLSSKEKATKSIFKIFQNPPKGREVKSKGNQQNTEKIKKHK